MRRFKYKINWKEGLMFKLAYGLKHGLWFQRLGLKFYVPPQNIEAYFDSQLGTVMIYFHSDNPCTIATYSIMSYRQRWAVKKEDLIDIYDEEE